VQTRNSYGSNFDSLKTYIRNQQRTAASSPLAHPKLVTTLAVTDATLLDDIEWAVVDVETTGLSFKWCRVIDVAAVILSKHMHHGITGGGHGDSVQDPHLHTALHTLVNPLPIHLDNPTNSPNLPPVPKRILELTGITREVASLHPLIF
jgi:DNA polymerase III epsilon subunit-like protein